ncbi:hypothetical protein J2S05_002508 [Alkalicoccobacillus murimartini]|uniref:Uncharacterized protein n=1 Tax=Alkalicoccobacillus murimartini TaxID=171685 RepID=A0ABT9YIQ5_9BACI|nr:hypothetical protein [Alkalicoccobacillus murimartini]
MLTTLLSAAAAFTFIVMIRMTWEQTAPILVPI